MWEQELLLWLHSHRTPFLDRVFFPTELIGSQTSFALLAIVVTAWHLVRRERRQAIAWVAVSVVVFSLRVALKMSVARSRTGSLPTPFTETSYAFPSGHALGSSAFYPLLAWTVFAARSKRKWPWMVLAVFASLIVGFGRLYMGLHWPTDVMVGWVLGFSIALAAITWLRKRPIPRHVI